MQRTPPGCTPTSPKTSWIDDEVIQLRIWGSEDAHRFPTDVQRFSIGTASSCEIQVQGASKYVSRKHAYLERSAERWCIVDQSKNGLYLDGELRKRAFITPGMRVNLGPRVMLVAESARTIVLRTALARMMGWSADLADSLDRAFQNLRLAPSGKAIFMLCGEGELLTFAHELHRLTLSEQRPFVVCGEVGKRKQQASSEEKAEDMPGSLQRVSSGLDAVALGRGGTICLDNRRLPKDLTTMFKILGDGGSPTQVFVLAKYVRKTEVYTPAPFEIPPLYKRASEVDRLITEYEIEAKRQLSTEHLELTAVQRTRIRARCKTLSDLQKATQRLLALRQAGTLRGAAALLGMSQVALGEWLHGRGLLP